MEILGIENSDPVQIKIKEQGRVDSIPLREALAKMDSDNYSMVSRKVMLAHWDNEMRFCSRDGYPVIRNSPISKVCGYCGTEYFPTLSPAIVVLVKRGEEALLVKARSFRSPVYALVAGFVEYGETLEECVKREVLEETSLIIDDIKYVGSQSWPFPHQLMIGFTARYVSGEINFADNELIDGGFFSREQPPKIPTAPSLTHQIIQRWLDGKL